MEQIYTYDGNRNLKTIRAQYSRWYDQDFVYDALSRLKHVTNVHGDFDNTYDKVGNRLTRTENGQVSTYEYIAGTNRIDNISGPDGLVNYSYDAGGNITGIGNRTLVYNQSNRLMRVEQDGSPLGEYTYNGLGQRVIKQVGGATTIFQYDFDGNIIAESAPSGKFTYEYLYAGPARIAMVDVLAGNIYSFLNNFNGTPTILTDQDGMVVWEADYKPFGEALVNSNSEVVNNFRFAGQYFDEETGLHYNYFRYYDPASGRYLRPDPIGLVGGINLFAYAQLNPINLTDPFGLFCRIEGTPGIGPRIGDTWLEAQKIGYWDAVLGRLMWELFKIRYMRNLPPIPDEIENKIPVFKYRVRYTEYESRLIVTNEFYVCYDDCTGEETLREPIGQSNFGKTQVNIVGAYEVDKYFGDSREYNRNNNVDPLVINE